MTKHVLLTGASGFVGRHLMPSLIARGYRVTVATRRAIGPGYANVDLVPVSDLRHEIDWTGPLEGVDAVVHLAALAHITSAIPESEYDQINHRAAVRLAEAAARAGARFVFASSVAAQSGPSSKVPLTEEDRPQPTTPYGRSKLRAEQGIAKLSDNFVILRPTLIYGAGVIGNMQRLVRLAQSRVPPPFGLIRNQRSVLAIENMCEAVHFALNSNSALNNVFLVADRDPISTSDMVKQLRMGAGLKPRQLPVPPQILFSLLRLAGRGDIEDKIAGDLIASVAKLEKLGFRWCVNSREGLLALGAMSVNRDADLVGREQLGSR
jgi:UDP-glucose 4-epimerase